MIWIGILFFGGIILIASEFILPGAIMGILGFCMLVGSVALGWNYYPDYGWLIALIEFVVLIFTLVGGFWVMANTRVKNLVVMDGVQNKDAGYAGPAQSPDLVGQTALSHTPLRPAGIIIVDDERIDAVSDGTYIEAGSEVIIVQVEGHRVVVEQAESGTNEAAS